MRNSEYNAWRTILQDADGELTSISQQHCENAEPCSAAEENNSKRNDLKEERPKTQNTNRRFINSEFRICITPPD